MPIAQGLDIYSVSYLQVLITNGKFQVINQTKQLFQFDSLETFTWAFMAFWVSCNQSPSCLAPLYSLSEHWTQPPPCMEPCWRGLTYQNINFLMNNAYGKKV